ncbi:MAG: toprim domain-containing protein, partial [Bacteroidota bacterium]
SIVLNSTSCLEQALPYLYEYGYKNFYTWLDNDVAGRNATIRCSEFATTQNGLVHRPMNEKYIGHKDVNEWHMHTLNLTL